jgi:hypothetical protein
MPFQQIGSVLASLDYISALRKRQTRASVDKTGCPRQDMDSRLLEKDAPNSPGSATLAPLLLGLFGPPQDGSRDDLTSKHRNCSVLRHLSSWKKAEADVRSTRGMSIARPVLRHDKKPGAISGDRASNLSCL